MKKILIPAICLLSSCSLLNKVPDDVVKGQLALYAGIENLEDNYETMITEVTVRHKMFVTYMHNFAFQTDLRKAEEEHPIEQEPSAWQHENEEEAEQRETNNRENLAKIANIRSKLIDTRDANIRRDHAKVDEIMNKWRKRGEEGHRIVKQLAEAVYNNISESPISVDNIATIVNKSQQLWEKINETN